MTAEFERQDDLLKRRCEYDNEWKLHTLEHVGQAIHLAVDRFANIGELIGNDNPEVKDDMFNSCKIAKDAGKSIQHLCEISAIPDIKTCTLSIDQESIVIACRSLFSAITRILLLVDIAIVKQLLTSKKQISRSLKKIDSILNFTDFVRAFSLFGNEMVELAFLTGSIERRQLKEERRKSQLHAARLILERSITVLLTASKCSLVHRECMLAKENRDTVFCQIRRAMDLIHFVVKDSIFELPLLHTNDNSSSGYKNFDKGTVHSTYKDFLSCLDNFHYKLINQEHSLCNSNNNFAKPQYNNILIENNWSTESKNYDWPIIQSFGESGNNYLNEHCKKAFSHLNGGETKEELLYALDKLLEKIQDFTDCAYTSHEHRQKILFLSYRCRLEVNKYLNRIPDDECMSPKVLPHDNNNVVSVMKKLSEELVFSVRDQIVDLQRSIKMSVNLAKNFYVFALKQDVDQLQDLADRFHDYCDHIIDVCKLLRHVATSEALQVEAKFISLNLRIYGPQVLTAAKILLNYPCSAPASENFEAFLEIWKWLTTEITSLIKRTLDIREEFKETAKDYTYLDHKVTPKVAKVPYKEDAPEKAPVARKDVKEATCNRVNATNNEEKWNELADNDILKRAKNMSAMAFSMYQFTKGNGSLRTTQDLFTQAEYFAEEANRLYKILRQFSYQVPAGDNKKELLNILDRVPTFVQTLQFTVKDHTVGKAATFVKVDHVIRETKNLMNVINKVVNSCFECANKYNLDFSGLSGGLTSGSRGEDNSSGGMSDSKGASNSTEGSM